MTVVRSTRRWRGVVAVPLLAGAAGALFANRALLLASVVGVVYAAYPRLTGLSEPDVEVDRSLDADGDGVVEVTVTARNAGDRPLPELRLADGVPPSASVIDGSPRHATALRPGGTTSFSYTVQTRAPERLNAPQFGPTTVVARDSSGATEAEMTVEHEADGDRSVAASIPLRRRTRAETGRLASGEGGSGLEFHHVRRYRRGDPQSRIDWRRFARTGELSTVAFRRERAPSVAFCLDARPAAYRSNDDGPHAVAAGVEAIRRLYAGLRKTNARAGLLVLGRDERLSPGTGAEHDVRFREALSAVPDRSPAADGGVGDGSPAELRRIGDRLAAETQVVFVTPTTDEFALEAALTFEAADHPVTVLSPDVTATGTLGERLATVERDRRLRSLRRSGVRVVDWDREESLERAVARARNGWSA